jgi:CubicO group peptidase (beta-lactamase class C family)
MLTSTQVCGGRIFIIQLHAAYLALERSANVTRWGLSEILAISGSPGLSLGVLHQEKVTHTAHFGNQNISYPSPPNNATIYRIASLTKVITACATAVLVAEGSLKLGHTNTRDTS